MIIMDEIKWLLEKNIFKDMFFDNLVDCLENKSIDYKIKHLYDENLTDVYEQKDFVVSYGSFNFIHKIQKETPWGCGIFHNLDYYLCSNYYNYYGDFLFNSPYIMLPVGDLFRMRKFIIDTLSPNIKKVFIRPDRGDKIWTGQVVSSNEIENFVNHLLSYKIDKKEIAICSTFRTIAKEWRAVISNNKIISVSQYQPINQIGCPNNVLDFINNILLKDSKFDDIFVMDICQDMKNDIFLLEAGGFSCAGLYHNNADDIIDAVSLAAFKKYQERIQ